MTRKRAVGAIVSGWAVVLATLFLWLASTPGALLRDQLRRWQFWSLELCFALLLALGVIVSRSVWRDLDRRQLAAMGSVALLAIGLTLFVAPRTNRIFYDEQIYQSIGQNLADLRLAQMCNDGVVEYGRLQCLSGEYNKQPYAYPHLLSVAYRLVGVEMRWAFWVNALVIGLTVCVVYLTAWFLFRDRVTAFFAALLVALIPQQLLWSATAAAEPAASLACVGALAAAAYFTVSRTPAALAFAAVAAAYAVQFRPESFLIVPVVGLLLLMRTPDELWRPRLWWAGLLFLVLVAVHVGHIFAVRNEGWGTAEARLSLGYLDQNFAVNGRFYVADERFPVAISLLVLIGIASRQKMAARVSLASYFVLFFVMYLLFYAGSYNYGADVRYSLLTYPPLALLGGLGAARISRWMQTRRFAASPTVAITAVLALQFSWYVPLIRATTEEAWAARSDVRFVESMVPALRGNAYVLTHNPNMFHVWGVNAGQLSVILNNPSYVDYLATRYAGGVYLHWNFWCNVQVPAQQEVCRRALDSRPSKLVNELRERDQRFAFYLLQSASSTAVH
jgi:Dolichyl-phosphate-mannose-protein mannosyltransferase